MNDNLRAPIAANSVIGKITYTYEDETYSADLIAETDVIASDFLPIVFRVLLIFVTLYLLFLLLKPSNKNNGKLNKSSKKKSYYKKTKRGNFKFTQLNNY